MSFSATIPVAQIDTANAALQAQGFGPRNFSEPLYQGAGPTHAGLHSWDVPGFRAAVAAIPNVQITDGAALAVSFPGHVATRSLGWAGSAPLLQGQVTPGLYRDNNDVAWWVIQAFDRAVFNLALETYPALVRRARMPGVVAPWLQPLDQFDAYFTVNSFTGQPDRVTHAGRRWRSAVAGVPNVFTPGAGAEWIDEGPA